MSSSLATESDRSTAVAPSRDLRGWLILLSIVSVIMLGLILPAAVPIVLCIALFTFAVMQAVHIEHADDRSGRDYHLSPWDRVCSDGQEHCGLGQ